MVKLVFCCRRRPDLSLEQFQKRWLEVHRPKTGGRKKGTPNVLTSQLRDMILGALSAQGGQAYLERQAEENPSAFLGLVAKCLPKDMHVDTSGPIVFRWEGQGEP